ncbi:MAG: DUF2490 domain-containing protein [Bacteroidales bacterium]|nr:DUF2490 domain-containing protein [Bacteroidales bacterium]
MKKLILIAALLLPLAAGAQEFCARTSVGADYKIKKGFHLEVEEELRLGDGLSSINSVRSTVGLSYKVSDYFKFGGGYTLINPYKFKYHDDGTLKYQGFWYPRHRLFVEATGSYRRGDFQFSLKEKLQFTHRTDDSLNVYQNTRNALSLKSRVGVKYKGLKDYGVEPFAHFELRTALNEPWGTTSGSLQTTPNTKRDYYVYKHTGYTHVYNNRYRVNLGVDYEPVKHHTFTLNALLDWCSDYEIDTNGPSKWETEKGVRLFTATTGWNDYFCASVCLGYVFSF